MKILYDNVSPEYSYPLSRADVIQIKQVVPAEIVEKIKCIEFGCNTRTTQEGRLVQHGERYRVRINFCLYNFTSSILSNDAKYIRQIKELGGVIELGTQVVTWKAATAKRYAYFLLLHEIGHIIYCEKYANGHLGRKGAHAEEQWSDEYAMQALQALDKKGVVA